MSTRRPQSAGRPVWKGNHGPPTRATAERIVAEEGIEGDQAAASGSYTTAIKHYTTAIKLRQEPELLAKRARCYGIMGDHQRAVCDLSLASRLEPANWSHRVGRASSFRELY